MTAAEADPSRGALYERVLAAYLAPAIDPVTGDYRTSEPCAPMLIFAESIGEDDAFQGEVEARMENLQEHPEEALHWQRRAVEVLEQARVQHPDDPEIAAFLEMLRAN